MDFVLGAFKLVGNRWVGLYFAETTGAARLAIQLYALVLTDFVFAASLVLAPFGAVLAKRRDISVVLSVWPPLVVLVTAVAAYAGPRYRSPFELLLYVYFGVLVAGEWSTPSRRALIVASALSLVFFLALR
jgi:hypothetical protein